MSYSQYLSIHIKEKREKDIHSSFFRVPSSFSILHILSLIYFFPFIMIFSSKCIIQVYYLFLIFDFISFLNFHSFFLIFHVLSYIFHSKFIMHDSSFSILFPPFIIIYSSLFIIYYSFFILNCSFFILLSSFFRHH